ncbi:E3 ubiquitin-protein ligase TRIM39-like [Boleophthalmus pectinirostris]|uniref:E3 ubiquitin-protein ligase TRIM39-like n=1 Tax=Boleophthalmus pectinirostris TaxID=150288 RepID=UPI0024301BF7|nr:E3 ubiquitin-protein ligase TRIM39-like [Boleophthalmus pectinirostris]
MASAPPLLSEEQLMCPICLGVFVRPVSTPCGHNFCMTCLSSYWDQSPVTVCPVCKESYSQRPQLRVNTFISGLSQSFMNKPLTAEETKSRGLRAEVGGTDAKISSMIQERVQKVQSIRQALAQRQTQTGYLTKTIQDLTPLVKKMEEKQQQMDFEVAVVVGEIEKEIKDLTETQMKLRDVNLNEDAQFLQRYTHNFAQKPPEVNLYSEIEMQQLRTALGTTLSKLQVYLDNMGGGFMSDISALKYAQQFAMDVTLDPKTAHHRLILSRDLKQVKFNPDANAKPSPVSNPAKFTKHLAVLGGRGIQSGKFYFEVLVGTKTEWIVGVALASLERKGKIPHAPGCGVYAVCFRMSYFETFSQPNVPIHQGKIEKVGVFVDYDGREVSFYDVNGAKLIYTFEDCAFSAKVHPYFNPCNNEFGNNLGPLVIVPVNL